MTKQRTKAAHTDVKSGILQNRFFVHLGTNAQVAEHTEGDTRLFAAGSKSGKTTPLKALLVKVRSIRATSW